MFGAGGIKTAARWTTLKILGYLGLTQLFATAGAYLLGIGAAMVPALLGILIVGGAIGAIVLSKMLIEAIYGKSTEDIGATINYATANPEWAVEHGVYPGRDVAMEGLSGWRKWLLDAAEMISSSVTGGVPGLTDYHVQYATAGATDAEVPNPDVDGP